jgi:immunity protein 50 of polymorphic toxin system
VDVINAEALVDRFGEWPSFHDAEVLGLRLDSGQRTDGIVRLQLDVHVFAIERGAARDRLSFVNHTLATLEFDEVEAVEFEGFGPQNVLDDLLLEDVHLAAGRQIRVTLASNNGLGGSFRCRSVTVLAAAPHAPGQHSVYGA